MNQVKSRLRGHLVFFDLIKLGKYLELRSNWKIYVQGFAFEFATGVRTKIKRYLPKAIYISKFEKKYTASAHELFRLIVEKDVRLFRTVALAFKSKIREIRTIHCSVHSILSL